MPVQAVSIIFGAFVLLCVTYASADSVRFAYVTTTADGEYEVSFSDAGSMREMQGEVKLIYRQLDGLHAGYKKAKGNTSQMLSYDDLLWLNIQGDLEDLMEALDTSPGVKLPLVLRGRKGASCSALIKLLDDSSDLYTAQDTWSSLQSMLRVLKKYNFGFHPLGSQNSTVPGRSVSFSSYPGTILSNDDFYITSAGLVTQETTIGNSNASLWSHVKPVGQVLEFARVLVANRLGHCGRSWSKIFSLYNSGTYNNQWMIVDYNRFKPGTKRSQLKNNLLWVLEQIPGYIKAADKTDVLRNQSYWPSYNAAYFPEVFNLSGVPVLVEKYGDWFTYDRTPRARIFRRDHVKVRDIQSMMSLMRYSDYQHDNLSRCDECTPKQNAENIIACRSDLNPANGTYPFQSLGHRSHVATDSKVTGSSLVLNLQFWAASGPPHGGSTPVFDWSTSDFGKSTPHLGHPVRWEFPPLLQRWESDIVVNRTVKGR
uniref:Phospholipase B-like n=1 Tax=Timema tahoe TaxID=61484 RepID=A0A7R9IIJ1_9NEOP|nr:unnamed protein product [Timema tahoe]